MFSGPDDVRADEGANSSKFDSSKVAEAAYLDTARY